MRKRFLISLGLTCLFLFVSAGCNRSDTGAPAVRRAGDSLSTIKSVPSTVAQDNALPVWIQRSRRWPDTIRATLDSALEMRRDGFMLRLRTKVSQDVSDENFQGEKPLSCEILMTVRPVPEWRYAKDLAIDSVVFVDPVRHRTLPGVPMLSFERTYEGGTVRTVFLPNMAIRQSPDLTEGQTLEPTIYLTWGKRLLIIKAPSVSLTFHRGETKQS